MYCLIPGALLAVLSLSVWLLFVANLLRGVGDPLGGRTRGELDSLLEKSAYGKKQDAYSAYFWINNIMLVFY